MYEPASFRLELAKQQQAVLLAEARNAQLRPDLEHVEPGTIELARGLGSSLKRFLTRRPVMREPMLQPIQGD